MREIRISKRITLYEWDDLLPEFGVITRIASIEDSSRFLVFDSYLGEDFMEEAFGRRELRDAILINSHHDWDHVWGNGYFSGPIIAHERCREEIVRGGERDRMRYGHYGRGWDHFRLPNILFRERLDLFGLSLFSTPGHSVDSISLLDKRENILFTGDLAEKPYPSDRDESLLQGHIASLERCRALSPELVVPSHGPLLGIRDLEDNREDLIEILRGKTGI